MLKFSLVALKTTFPYLFAVLPPTKSLYFKCQLGGIYWKMYNY